MSDQDDLQQRLVVQQRYLDKLNLKRARYGPNEVPVSVEMEIEDVQAEIEDLQGELQHLARTEDISVPVSAEAQGLDERNKRKLLRKVEAFWIRRVLGPSLRHTGYISLDLGYKSGAVEGPWDDVRRHDIEAGTRTPPSGGNITNVFDEAEGRLLILGEPGAGKTVALLELACDLVDRVKQGCLETIPVIFNLSSWGESGKSIESWLADELSDKYQIPRETGQALVAADQLLLLLDGLDEVKSESQEDCAKAINVFVQGHSDVKLAVCCRNADYEAIPTHLRLSDAIVLKPLTARKMEECLAKTDVPMTDLRQLIEKDQGWRELARSPLFLHIMIVASQTTADSVPEFKTMEEGRAYLLNAYVDSVFEPGSPENGYSRKQTLDWLSWLAQKMLQHGQDLFLIEKIQPDWLPIGMHRLYGIGIRVLVGLMVGLAFGLATGVSAGMVFGPRFGVISTFTFGLAWGLIGWLVFERSGSWWATLAVALASGMAFGVAGWLALGGWAAIVCILVGALASGLAFGFGCRQLANINSLGTPEKVVLVEALRWSWTKASRSLGLWILFGLLVGLGIGIPVWLAAGPAVGWVYGIATALVYVMTFGIAGGLTTGEIETKTLPNQGIWRSSHNAGRYGMRFGLVIGLIFGIAFGITFGPMYGLIGCLTVGLAGWMVGWYFFGGITYMQHYFLRGLLAVRNDAPWGYSKFLNHASNRILLLRRVGGGYIFLHRIMLEYFAQLD
jgi:eukaryotic-like serine/threonine-protein kinase